MSRDGDEKAARDGDHLLPPVRQLARDPDARSDQRGVSGVSEEEAKDLPRVPLEAGRDPTDAFWAEDLMQARHVRDRLQEVEAEPDRGAIDDPVYDVVELVAHDQEEQEHRGAIGQLLEQP